MLSALPELPVYAYLPIELVEGHGATVIDADGNRYLDFYGGHAVATVGHSHPKLVEAIAQQAQKLLFYSNATSHPARRDFCRRLLELGPGNMTGVFLCNSGAEANENALAIARRMTGRKTVVSVSGGFHGRTLLTLSLSGLPNYRKLAQAGEEYLLPNIRILPAHDEAAIDELVDEDCAAVIVEPVQGLAGAVTFSHEYLSHLLDRCEAVGAQLIFDEVQCGSGRTGRFTAAQSLRVRPHILTLAKGLAGGFPIGALLCDQRASSSVGPGALGSTFGGGPLACAAGLAVLAIMEEENLFANAWTVGEYLTNRIRMIPGVRKVDGLGLLIGVTLEKTAKEVRDALLQTHRIVVGTSADPQVVRLMPPLSITQEQADVFIAALTQSLS